MTPAEKKKVAAALLHAANVLEGRSSTQEYKANQAKVDKLMKQAHKLLAEHAKKGKDSPDWGYAGDLGHVGELLQQIVDFLSNAES